MSRANGRNINWVIYRSFCSHICVGKSSHLPSPTTVTVTNKCEVVFAPSRQSSNLSRTMIASRMGSLVRPNTLGNLRENETSLSKNLTAFANLLAKTCTSYLFEKDNDSNSYTTLGLPKRISERQRNDFMRPYFYSCYERTPEHASTWTSLPFRLHVMTSVWQHPRTKISWQSGGIGKQVSGGSSSALVPTQRSVRTCFPLTLHQKPDVAQQLGTLFEDSLQF